jgi:hypothetical protein
VKKKEKKGKKRKKKRKKSEEARENHGRLRNDCGVSSQNVDFIWLTVVGTSPQQLDSLPSSDILGLALGDSIFKKCPGLQAAEPSAYICKKQQLIPRSHRL